MKEATKFGTFIVLQVMIQRAVQRLLSRKAEGSRKVASLVSGSKGLMLVVVSGLSILSLDYKSYQAFILFMLARSLGIIFQVADS